MNDEFAKQVRHMAQAAGWEVHANPTGAPVNDLGEVSEDVDTAELDALDEGHHHLWCRSCHPDWDASPIGPGLGVPFTAWCGVRAVILVRHLSDEIPPNACTACAAPDARCPTCGAR